VNSKFIKSAEWIVAILISTMVLILLIVRATHAGALWRDECDSLELARMPTFADIVHNLKFTSFPILFPTTVRLFTTLFGTSDTALRWFGFLVGASLLIVAWVNARGCADVPLILPALVGLNATFLTVGTWIRGYGLGSVLVTLSFGLTVLFIAQPTILRLLSMFVCYIASMQLLYFPAALVPAFLVAAFAVCLFRRQLKWALALCVVAAVCALSYVPKFLTYFEIRDWVAALQRKTTPGELWREFMLACGDAQVSTWIWIIALAMSILGAVWMVAAKSRRDSISANVFAFAAFTIVLAVPMYFVFLWTLHNIPETRYYLSLLCALAATIELIIGLLAQFAWVRIARLVLVICLAVALPILAWPKVTERETNLDLLAKNLQTYAHDGDLIIVNRWFLAPGFNWYYHGAARWMTLPELSEKRIHRYDLLIAKMQSADPLADIRAAMSETLQSGNRVWLVGGAQLTKQGEPFLLSPAPDPKYGWDSGMYDYSWATQLGAFLQQHVVDGEIVLSPMKGVNSNENVPLLIARGWKD
jgi:hypothetical protein